MSCILMVSEAPPYPVYIVETLLGMEANLGDNHCQPNMFNVSQGRVISSRPYLGHREFQWLEGFET
jgi:hypothetical protein